MSDKRIIQLTETQTIAADDYVPVDGATGGTKKFLASNLGGKAEVMTESEWDDLPDSKLTDGKVYALSGVSPSTQDNPLWQKLGFAALDTEADDCSDAINELNTGLTTLNSNLENLTHLHLTRISATSSIRQALIDSPVGISFYESQKATDNPLSGTIGLVIILKLADSGNYSQIWVFSGNNIYKSSTATSIPDSLTFTKIN